MRVTFEGREQSAKNIWTYWFRPEKPLRYIAGQFTELRLPHPEPDSRGEHRWFTLSSSPAASLVSITTRIYPKTSSSFKRALAALESGARLTMAEPMGDFVLPIRKDIPLLFVAAGLGITPMHSMVQWLQDSDEHRAVRLLHAVSSPEEAAFRQVFESAPIDFDLLVQYPSARGERLTASSILSLSEMKQNPSVYIAGPEAFTENLYRELRAQGVPPHRLITDYFPGYTSL